MTSVVRRRMYDRSLWARGDNLVGATLVVARTTLVVARTTLVVARRAM